MSWSRYRSARICDDLVVLTLDTNVMQLLPIPGLASGHCAPAAADAITGWIEAARTGSASAA